MNGRILLLLPGMAIVGAAWGQARTADVLYSYRGNIPVRAYRLGDECFVPINATAGWGWKVERNGDTSQITAEDQTVAVPVRVVGGTASIAMRRAVELLGGGSEWIATTDTLQVWSPLSSLRVRDGKVVARTPLEVKAYGSTLSSPDRAVIDFDGARLGPKTKLDLPKGARATQFRPNVVRLVVETPFVPVAPALAGVAGREIALDLKIADLPNEPVPQDTTPPPIDPNSPPLSAEAPAPLTVEVLADADGKTVVQIPLGGRIKGPATFDKIDPVTLEVTLPFVQGFLPDDFITPTLAVMGFEAKRQGFDTILTLHLAKPMGAEVTTSPDGVQIALGSVVIGGGKLVGKVVVVDAGHGGHDSGAKSGGAMEKVLTLKVAKLLADELTKAGATVIMTRNTDVFIPLQIRSDISNRNHADMFIAVHINSTGGLGSQSGTISFHHKGNETGRKLAASIQAEMAKVNRLPNIGVWSDGKIYQSGFAVLRNTKQPAAVLLELGFINHPVDRARMMTEDFQKGIAAAIVRGVRTFLGDPSQ